MKLGDSKSLRSETCYTTIGAVTAAVRSKEGVNGLHGMLTHNESLLVVSWFAANKQVRCEQVQCRPTITAHRTDMQCITDGE